MDDFDRMFVPSRRRIVRAKIELGVRVGPKFQRQITAQAFPRSLLGFDLQAIWQKDIGTVDRTQVPAADLNPMIRIIPLVVIGASGDTPLLPRTEKIRVAHV